MDDMMSRLQNVLNDEESMNQIKKLAEMLGQGNGEEMPDLSSLFGSNNSNSNDESDKKPGDINFDMSKIIAIQKILQQANQKDKNTNFLYALKPLLKNESQIKIDRVTKVFKLLAIWPLIKESGLLGGDLFDIL